MQLQMDEDRVYNYLFERGVLTDSEIAKKNRYLMQLRQMGVHPQEAVVNHVAEQLLKFRQNWSIPQYNKIMEDRARNGETEKASP